MNMFFQNPCAVYSLFKSQLTFKATNHYLLCKRKSYCHCTDHILLLLQDKPEVLAVLRSVSDHVYRKDTIIYYGLISHRGHPCITPATNTLSPTNCANVLKKFLERKYAYIKYLLKLFPKVVKESGQVSPAFQMSTITINLRENEHSAFRYIFKVLHFQQGIILSKPIFGRGFVAMNPDFNMVGKCLVLARI